MNPDVAKPVVFALSDVEVPEPVAVVVVVFVLRVRVFPLVVATDPEMPTDPPVIDVLPVVFTVPASRNQL